VSGEDGGLGRSLSDSALLVLGSLLAAVLGFVGLRFLLTGLSEADYGRYILFQTAAGVLLVFMLWPVPAVLRLGAEEVAERRSLSRVAGSVLLLMLLSLVGVTAVVLIGRGSLEAWLGWEAWELVLGFAAASALAGFACELLKPAGKVGLRTLVPAVGRGLFAAMLGLLVVREQALTLPRAAVLTVITTLPAVVIPVMAVGSLIRRPWPERRFVNRATAYGWPLLLRNLGIMGLLTVDVFVIRHVLGEVEVGRYEVAYRIAEQVVVFGFVLEHLCDPLLAGMAARGDRAALSAYQRLAMPQLAWLWGLGAALMIPLAEPMLVLLGAKSAALSAGILQVVLVGVALRGVTTLENPLLSAHMLSFWPTVFFFAALALNLILDLTLLQTSLGLYGPALATVAAFALQGVLRSLYLGRLFGAGSWRCYVATLPALAVLAATLLGSWPVGLLAWAAAAALVLGAGRGAGLFPAETARILDRVRMPDPLRQALARFYAGAPATPAPGPRGARPVPAVLPDPDPQRRRLLLLVTELHPAGAERIVFEIATRLDPAVWQVLVCSLRSRGDDDGAIARELQWKGVAVLPLRLQGKLDLAGAWRLRAALQRFRPDVLHAHLFHANLAARLLRGAGARHVVGTVHVVERRRLPLRFLLERLTAGRDDLTVCVSKAVAEHARRRLGVRRRRLRVVPNGIDVRRFGALPDRDEARAELGLPRTTPVIGAVGRLDRQKGLPHLIEAFARLDHPTARLVIAGSGGEEPALRLLVRQHRLADRVRFLGFRSDVPRVLAALDVFCMPSLWEGFGLALVEAMAAGVPAVVSRIDSLPEVLGEAGVLVPPADAAALATALGELLADTARREELARRGRERAQQFSLESMLAGYEAVYGELLGD
jgi:glycosyltransferase involved in cell wall biosynthesis/O-antigen/teichoic acid export membrane protein